MKFYYLANQFKYRHDGLQLQKKLEYYHDLYLVNPFYDGQRQDVYEFDKAEHNGIVLPLRSIDRCQEIMFDDLQMISDSDGIICILYDHDALGSFIEIFYCSYILKLPVYLICAEPSIRDHLWIRALCWKIFSNIEEFVEYVMLNPKEMK